MSFRMGPACHHPMPTSLHQPLIHCLPEDLMCTVDRQKAVEQLQLLVGCAEVEPKMPVKRVRQAPSTSPARPRRCLPPRMHTPPPCDAPAAAAAPCAPQRGRSKLRRRPSEPPPAASDIALVAPRLHVSTRTRPLHATDAHAVGAAPKLRPPSRRAGRSYCPAPSSAAGAAAPPFVWEKQRAQG